MLDKLRKTENLHVFLWLIKDMCWMLEFKPIAIFMIFPTLIVAFYVLFLTRKNVTITLVNASVICWIMANSLWMLSDFIIGFNKNFSLVFFILGIIIMLVYFGKQINFSTQNNTK